MVDEVACPSCGGGNERSMAEAYRVCVHCGGDLGAAVSGASPMDDLQRSIDGTPPPVTPHAPPTQQTPPQQYPPFADPGYQPYQQPPPGQTPYQQPPPYGQPPPGYGAQPYGGQPYPPPAFGAGPYYGAPAMYPPTYHPGLYDKPERAAFLDIGNLFRLLFRPKEAFEDLHDHTSATQGFILAVVFIAFTSILGILANLVFLGSVDLPEDTMVPLFTESNAVVSVIGIFTGVFFFWLTAWMFHAFVKEKSRHPSLDKTIGMMGYAKFPAFIIMTLIAVLTPLMMVGLVAGADQPPDFAGAVCGTMALIFGLGILGVLWAFWVHSHAQSVANDMSLSSAFGWLLLTWILVGLIQVVVGLVIAFAVLGATLGM